MRKGVQLASEKGSGNDQKAKKERSAERLKAAEKNKEVYNFEKMLERKNR